jgi:hypothetical protein
MRSKEFTMPAKSFKHDHQMPTGSIPVIDSFDVFLHAEKERQQMAKAQTALSVVSKVNPNGPASTCPVFVAPNKRTKLLLGSS